MTVGWSRDGAIDRNPNLYFGTTALINSPGSEELHPAVRIIDLEPAMNRKTTNLIRWLLDDWFPPNAGKMAVSLVNENLAWSAKPA